MKSGGSSDGEFNDGNDNDGGSKESGCNSDADCSSAQFCRATTRDYNGPKKCVARQAKGQHCGGCAYQMHRTHTSHAGVHG